MTIAIVIIAWLIGSVLCYWMMKTEHEAEKEVFTKGNMVFAVLFSILSWIWVIVLLSIAWFKQIGKAYWNKPAKEKKPIVEVVAEPSNK